MTVQLTHITKQFGTTYAIRDLSLALPERGIVAIMGPSGCGKTTLLQLLAGLTKANEGELTLSSANTAYVFQEPRLLPWRTVADNIRLARHKDAPPPTKTIEEWLCAVGLDGQADKYPDELSGGMKQRVAIARALYCESELLLLDEAFKGLDEATRRQVMTLVKKARHTTDRLTVMVTHDRTEAEAMADLIITFDAAPASSYRTECISCE